MEYNHTTPVIKINPEVIKVEQITCGEMTKYIGSMSKATTRMPPGRKLSFLVTHEQYLLGCITLASPVINLGVRDEYLGLNNVPSKGKELRKYMDMNGCVGAQPISWYWNIGKLCALIGATLGDYVKERYPDDDFIGVTTTSIYGKSIQYNRIYKFLGYTKGYGHEHISDEKYSEMMQWMRDNGYEIPSSNFGAGSNPRMRRIAAYRKASGDKKATLFHGKRRGVYYHPAIPPKQRNDVIFNWYERWGLPRYERLKNQEPPYQTGLD